MCSLTSAIIFFASNEKKSQLDHPNRKKQGVFFAIILFCGKCGWGKPLACSSWVVDSYSNDSELAKIIYYISYTRKVAQPNKNMICFSESKEKQVMKSNEVMYSIILYMYIWYMAYESTGLFPMSWCWWYQLSGG